MMKPINPLEWAGVICWAIVMATIILFQVHLQELALKNHEMIKEDQAVIKKGISDILERLDKRGILIQR